MKKATRFLLGIFTFSILISGMALAQNAIVGTGFTNGWSSPDGFGGSGDFEFFTDFVSGSYGRIEQANGTGNQFFRIGVDWGGTIGQHTITNGSDVEVSKNTEYSLNSSSTSSGAMYFNVASTSDNYVFKSRNAGSSPDFDLIIFQVEGAVRSISSVSNSLSGNAKNGDDVTVTATLDGSFSTGQSVYLRYTDDNYSNSTIVEMSGSGTSYTATIPGSTNQIGKTISYYVFTSGDGLTISSTDADFYTINLNNNSGSNYSYTVELDLSITGSEGWRMLSTPTSNNSYDDLIGDLWTQGIGTGADVTNGTANVQLYNTTTDNFAAATDLTATMTAGVGFIVYVYSDDDYTNSGADAGFPKTLSLSGTENSGTVTPTLNDGADAWTLVGNPYASTIDWDDAGKTEVTSTVYVYDHSVSGYKTWNGSTGGLTDGLVTPFQGFWVQNAASVTTPALSIEEADKSTGGTFYKQVVPTTLVLNAEMNELANSAYFSFNEAGELGRDNADGYELLPLDFANYMSLSTVVNGESFDINNLPISLEEAVEIPLQVAAFNADTEANQWTPMAGEVTLSWPMMSAIPEGWTIELKDYDTGASIDLMAETSYVFELTATEAKSKANKAYSVLKPVEVTQEDANDSGRFAIVVTPSTSVSSETEDTPEVFALEQNYPNPFNPSTTISYSVKEAGAVNISVYNLMGQKVATLVDETKAAGQYNVRWNAAGAASGMYYYRLEAGGQSITRKMTLIK